MTTFHSRDGVTSRLRLRGHDYASAASYFLTLCSEDRACLFSEIRDGEAHLTPAAAMIDSWWHFIPARFPSVMLDAMVVMPNHLHAIVHVGTDPGVSTPPPLGKLMHWFKSRTTYDYSLGVKNEGWPRFPGRLWQTKYYDHIIRNERSLVQIRSYIKGNPGKWAEDEYNPHGMM